MVFAGGLTAVTEGWFVVVMDVEEVLRIAGDCVTDRPKVLSGEGAGAVDIALVLEDNRRKEGGIGINKLDKSGARNCTNIIV